MSVCGFNTYLTCDKYSMTKPHNSIRASHCYLHPAFIMNEVTRHTTEIKGALCINFFLVILETQN